MGVFEFFRVKITLDAASILLSSLVTNLPPFSGSKVHCSFATLILTCDNVGSFEYSGTYEYFVTFKAHYSAAATASFGNVVIKTIITDSTGAEVEKDLYTALTSATTQPTSFANLNLLDTAANGWHDPNTYNIGST